MTTDPELVRRAHAMLMQVMDLEPERRRDRVRDVCADDPVLAARVMQLIDAADRADSFLDAPAFQPAPTSMNPVPDAIGNYLIVGVLGTGGMATVYEAIQEDPRRPVALKVLKQSLMASEDFARFRFETEALARLHHPAIAQIYEAGAARIDRSTSSPFFAMELIAHAMPITDYAEQKEMSLPDRLQMFTTVCDAVHHGHQQGVIHRDLKPANVLVDGEGRPKLIDFGIARATEAGADSLTGASGFKQLIGTLHAMSPEQCDASRDVDIRTDVYSLGVMLYQLVARRRPHDLSGCSIPDAIRIICEVEPPKASQFRPESVGDLDAILAKAMDKDRERRYDSAAALAADVRRYLAHLPIEARPASSFDQLRKFVRRNRPLAIASFAALLLLIVGSLLSVRLALLEVQARRASEQRERELVSVTEFQDSLLREINVAEMGDRLRMSLAESVVRVASTDDNAKSESAEAFQRLTEPVNFTSLAVQALNESVLQRHRESIKSRFTDQPVLQARLLQQLARTMNTLGLHAEAEPVLRETLTLRRSVLGDDDRDTLLTLHSLGSLLVSLGRYDEAVVALQEAYQRRSEQFGADNVMTLRTGTSLGGALRLQGNLVEAERIWSNTLRDLRKVLGDDAPETLRGLNNMGVAYAAQGRMDEAEACWRELLERRRRVLGENHQDYLSSLGNLCLLYLDCGRMDEARPLQPLIERALVSERRQFGDRHTKTLMTMAQLASLYQETGNLVAAEALQRECLTGRQSQLGPDSSGTLVAMTALAANLFQQDRLTEAEELALTALDSQRRVNGNQHPDTIQTLHLLGQIAHKAGRRHEASELSIEAIELARLTLPPSHWAVGQLLTDYGTMLLDAGKNDQARPLLQEGYKVLKAALGESHSRTREAVQRLTESGGTETELESNDP